MYMGENGTNMNIRIDRLIPPDVENLNTVGQFN